MRQKWPGSSLPFPFRSQLRTRFRTVDSLNQGVVSRLASLFFHMPIYTCDRDSHAPGVCTNSNAALLYPTRTLGLRNTPRARDAGLSAWIKQHSDPSRWDSARLSGMPRNLRPLMPVKADVGMATGKVSKTPDQKLVQVVPIPFQQLDTGTGFPLYMAFLDRRDRKNGQVCVACSWPSESRSAKVS